MVRVNLETAGSDVLYHITMVKALSSIARTNEFHLKPAEPSIWEEKFGASFYLSTARSKTSPYILNKTNSRYALVELDGRKLGQRYRVLPVDYWETNKPQTAEERLMMRKGRYEMEDRVLSRVPKIPNAKSYIKSVHCTYEDVAVTPHLIDVVKWCKTNKIPLFIYEDSKDTLRMNTKKAIRFDAPQAIKDFYTSKAYDRYTEHKEYTERRSKQALRHFRSGVLMAYWVLYATPLLSKDNRAEVLYQIDKAKPNLHIRDVAYSTQYRDTPSSLESALHEAKTSGYGEASRDRETLDKLVVAMRRHRWSVKDFIDFLAKKWT